jgi:hypothetical protein
VRVSCGTVHAVYACNSTPTRGVVVHERCVWPNVCRFYQMDKHSLQDHVGKIRVALCDKGNAPSILW